MGLGGLSHHEAAGDRHGVRLALLFTLRFILFDRECIISSPSRANLAGRARSTYIHIFVKSISLGAYMHLISIIIIKFAGMKRAKEGEEGEGDRDAERSRRR